MAKAMSLIWGVLKNLLFVSLGAGILLFLKGWGIEPQVYVARALNVAASPDNLLALSFMLAGTFGIALGVIWDAFQVQDRISARVRRRGGLDGRSSSIGMWHQKAWSFRRTAGTTN